MVSIKGEYQKGLEDDDAIISLNSKEISYNIAAKEIDIKSIAKSLNIELGDLDSLEIAIKINELNEDENSKIKQKAEDKEYEILFNPVSFNITAKHTKDSGEVKEEKIERFNSYLERVFRIPEAINPSKVTTGVVYNADGTFTHVPTLAYEEDGVYYAKVKSLTNSIYTIISNATEVKAVENHWAKTPVNVLAQRLVIEEIDDFNPKALLTRGAFTEYITKAIGIYRTNVEATQQKFFDVDVESKYLKAISIANEYGIISGYPDGSFKPEQTISRQEAMAMFANAMEVINFAGEDIERIKQYRDKKEISGWAYEGVRNVMAARVFNGKTVDTIAPLDTISYAETCTAIWNLLVEAKLINK